MESIVIERRAKWKILKQRLGLKAMGCCGASWSPRARISTISSILDEDDDEEVLAAARRQEQQVIINRSSGANNSIVNNRIHHNQTRNEINSATTPLLVGQLHQGSGMNLAMALAAERNLRAMHVGPSPSPTDHHHQVKTLMTLIEETDGVDWNKKKLKKETNNSNSNVEGGGGGSCDWMCCVCMERKKGAALIPCGHAFCRVCSKEVWLNRGSCPVCNRSILDILDIF